MDRQIWTDCLDQGRVIYRRDFLRLSAGVAFAAASGCHADTPDSASMPANPMPCDPARWQKHGVVLEATEPWEGGSVQNFTCRAEPLDRGSWRLWYSVCEKREDFNIAVAEGVPGEPIKKFPAVCTPGEPADAPLSIGNLPAEWRPVQPVHILLPSGRHRLYFWVHGPKIVRYLAAESDDGRRYRVLDPLRAVLYHPSDRAAFGVASPDGLLIHKQPDAGRPADEPPAISRQISNDATNLYQLSDGSFEMYSVALLAVPKTDPAYVAEDNAAGLVRVIDRYTSADGLHFDDRRRRVIAPDPADPPDQQFYYLAVTPTPFGRVGMLGHYRCKAQTMDLEWCYSTDGINWRRPRRNAWLPRGNPPEPDCYGIYGNSQLVHRDGRWHLFYTAVNSAHNGKHSYGPPRQCVMLATTDSLWAG